MPALSLAVENNTPDIVNMLIRNGADVHVVDLEGYNLIFYLMHSYVPQEHQSYRRADYFDAKRSGIERQSNYRRHFQRDYVPVYSFTFRNKPGYT